MPRMAGRLIPHFNPRSLAGATFGAGMDIWCSKISIHAPSRERQMDDKPIGEVIKISIHAPSRERLSCRLLRSTARHFNPRSLAGATLTRSLTEVGFRRFQSTLPRGSDYNVCSPVIGDQHFNPRSLAGATYPDTPQQQHSPISIHAPSRERRDSLYQGFREWHFNPRSLAGATSDSHRAAEHCGISIHAPSRERLSVILFSR